MGQATRSNTSFPTGATIGIVRAEFNEYLTSSMLASAHKRLRELGLQEENITVVDVPGCFEVPLACQWLLDGGCDAVIALGAVIRGGTPHFDYVCDAVTQGCTRLTLDSGKPVVFGILTCNNLDEAFERIGGVVGDKGAECAEVAAKMLSLRNGLIQAAK